MTTIQNSLLACLSPSRIKTSSNRFSFPFRNTVSAFDYPLIKQSLADAEDELEECRTELHRLKAATIAMESRRTSVKRDIEHYRSLLSPIQRMPPEILTEILRYCGQLSNLNGLTMPTPMVISMVCGRWREIAVSIPSLWSSISITMFSEGDPDYCDQQLVARLAKLFLQRSSKHPLELHLKWIGKEIDEEEVANLMDILHANSHRLREMSILVAPRTLTHPSFQLLQTCSFPILNQLKLTVSRYPGDADADIEGDMVIIDNAPVLRLLEFSRDKVNYELNLTWQTLGTLVLRGNSTGLRSMLSSCTNLHRLELHDMNTIEQEPTERAVSNIQQLSISICHEKRVARLLQLFTLPQLETLEFDGVSLSDQPEILRPLKDLIIRSACTITSFEVHYAKMTDVAIISLLYLMPQIRYFSFEEFSNPPDKFQPIGHNVAITSTFLRHLSLDRCATKSKPFLPKLTDLRLIVHKEGLDETSLVDAIDSRWHGQGELDDDDSSVTEDPVLLGLEAVTIGVMTCWDDWLTSTSLSALENLQDDGLIVNAKMFEPGDRYEIMRFFDDSYVI